MTTTCKYDLPSFPEGASWSGKSNPPAVGESVSINFNRLGPGTVESYFVEHGFGGVCVLLNSPPDWHTKQNRGTKNEGKALVFGKELAD